MLLPGALSNESCSIFVSLLQNPLSAMRLDTDTAQWDWQGWHRIGPRKKTEDIVNSSLHWLISVLATSALYTRIVGLPHAHLHRYGGYGSAIVPTINHAHFSATEPQPYNITLYSAATATGFPHFPFPSAFPLPRLAAHFSNASIHFSWRSSYIFFMFTAKQLLLCFRVLLFMTGLQFQERLYGRRISDCRREGTKLMVYPYRRFGVK